MSTQPTNATSPDLNELYAQRAELDAKITSKRKREAPKPTEEEILSEQFGADFVQDVGVETLKKVREVSSLSLFDNDPSMTMARGHEDRTTFLAFRIELLTIAQERVCVVTAKIFQTLIIDDRTQYTSSTYLKGDDENYYPSPIFFKKNSIERRETIRDLIEGRKFIWDGAAYKKDPKDPTSYLPLREGPKVHYFRILGGVQKTS